MGPLLVACVLVRRHQVVVSGLARRQLRQPLRRQAPPAPGLAFGAAVFDGRQRSSQLQSRLGSGCFGCRLLWRGGWYGGKGRNRSGSGNRSGNKGRGRLSPIEPGLLCNGGLNAGQRVLQQAPGIVSFLPGKAVGRLGCAQDLLQQPGVVFAAVLAVCVAQVFEGFEGLADLTELVAHLLIVGLKAKPSRLFGHRLLGAQQLPRGVRPAIAGVHPAVWPHCIHLRHLARLTKAHILPRLQCIRQCCGGGQRVSWRHRLSTRAQARLGLQLRAARLRLNQR